MTDLRFDIFNTFLIEVPVDFSLWDVTVERAGDRVPHSPRMTRCFGISVSHVWMNDRRYNTIPTINAIQVQMNK